jgi:hypothetical protein
MLMGTRIRTTVRNSVWIHFPSNIPGDSMYHGSYKKRKECGFTRQRLIKAQSNDILTCLLPTMIQMSCDYGVKILTRLQGPKYREL